jgi:hypothetical protein
MRVLAVVLLLAMMQAGTPTPATPPEATIANRAIKATLHLPNPATGYYRGTRFDWSGAISSLTWGGHEYFGQWFERYEPTIHDAIMGPVEEFLTGDSALGYAEAEPGGTFVRIGAGVARKKVEPAYQRFQTYEIVDHGHWTTNRSKDRIEFVHQLNDGNGYAYVYRKTLRLKGDTLVIDHELKNAGTKAIPTSVYDHNFFTLDRRITGPDVVVRFAFEPKPDRPLGAGAEIRGRELVYTKELGPKENAFAELSGFGPTAADNTFEIENRATGAGVRITGDRPIKKLIFWSAIKTVCPEPYIDVSVQPGQTSTWRITYTFYQVKK